MNDKVSRIIDANANRLGEALRVCEDIVRFVLSDKRSTQKFKSLRHRSNFLIKKIGETRKILTKSRDSEKDIGRKTSKSETKRKDTADIFTANMKRAEESARVLEEFSKLTGSHLSNRFKEIRFELYTLEKGVVEKL